MQIHVPLLLGALLLPVADQPASSSVTLKALLQKFVDAGEAAGIVTFVGNKDGVVDVEVLGMADLINGGHTGQYGIGHRNTGLTVAE